MTDSLCTRCGLCCSGTLFADVELVPSDNSPALEAMGLEIEEDDERRSGEVLLQPCAALTGRRCSIYPHRPKCCRTFECRVLKNVRLGALTLTEARTQIAKAISQIERVRGYISGLGRISVALPLKERVSEILLRTENATDPAIRHARDQLMTAMDSTEKYLKRTFLGI